MSTDEPRPPEEPPEGGVPPEGGAPPGETPPIDGLPEPGDEPPVEAPPELRCKVCDSLLAPDQTYCLECGTPTPIAPSLRKRGRLAWIVGIGLVILGLGAGALAYAISGSDDGTTTVVAGAPSVSVGDTTSLPPDTTSVETSFPTATESTSLPADTTLTDTTGTTDTTATTGTTTTVDTASFSSDWPSGRTGFTAVLSSVRDLGEAQGTADRVRGTGEPAGILFSSDYPGLSPGYYVVFSGVYSTSDQAHVQAQKLISDFPGAYVRHIQG